MMRDLWIEKMVKKIDLIERFYINLNKTVFIVDSSYLLSNDHLPFGYTTIIPSVVFDEICGLQRSCKISTKKRAQSATKKAEKHVVQNNVFSIVELDDFDEVKSTFKKVKRNGKDVDGMILSFCMFLQERNSAKQVVLLTHDRELKKRCTEKGIKIRI